MKKHTHQQFVAIVLAGDRTSSDPVARDAGTPCKALAPVAGKPMIMRVLDALQGSGRIRSIILCGPPPAALRACPELAQRIARDDICWIAGEDSPSKSAEAGLLQADPTAPVLLATADHALLNAEIVSGFLEESMAKDTDASFALIDYRRLQDAFPAVRRTVIKLQDGQYCACNLFAFMTAKGRRLVPFWRNVEQSRKRPWRMVATLMGIPATLAYVLGRLGLPQVLNRLSGTLGCKLSAVLLPWPRAGIDVDTPEDRKLVETILAEAEP